MAPLAAVRYKPWQQLNEVLGFLTATRCWNCGDGWEQFEGQCYYFSNITMKWQKAREMCQERGGDLVRINSSNEQVRRAARCLRWCDASHGKVLIRVFCQVIPE